MRRRCASFCQKNGRARRQARRGGASAGRDGPVGAAGLFIVGADRKMIRYRSRRPPDTELRAGCASLPMNAGGSATAGCSSCCGGRASRPGSTGSTGSIARKGSRCASGGPAAAPWGRGRRSWWKPGRTRAGRSISSTISSPTDGASASSTSSTTSPRNAWGRSRTPRSRDGGWRGN